MSASPLRDGKSEAVRVGTIRVCPRCGHEHRFRYVPVHQINEIQAQHDRLREVAHAVVDVWRKPASIDSATDLDSAIDELAMALAPAQDNNQEAS